MNDNRAIQRHWLGVLRHLSIDNLIFCAAFCFGLRLRFEEEWLAALRQLWPGILVGTSAFGCVTYIMGLYALQNAHQNYFKRAFLLTLGLGISIVLMLGMFYLNFSTRIGRGAMVISTLMVFGGAIIHHAYLLQRFRNLRERVALIVTCLEDESEAELLRDVKGHYLDVVGVVAHGYEPNRNFRVLGDVNDLNEIANRENLDRILCTNHSMMDPRLYRLFCQLRYSGINVMPLISVFEEICQSVPVELVTPEWLLIASGSPHMLYIKKLKRGFDVVVSLLGLAVSWPILLFAMIWVRLISPEGPVFYRQTRSGRFGKNFTLIKLRSMRPDAEAGQTAMWASSKDPRAFAGGNFLRKYRIDEIPQMWNVLRGDMSFVGPRPERPEFVEKLSHVIPYYRERLLVQPGITGWAQVNYPYGASVADARRKLEYDLYYTKNMSVFLDVFILLDTVQIILRGGATRKSHDTSLIHQRTKRRERDTEMISKQATVAANPVSSEVASTQIAATWSA